MEKIPSEDQGSIFAANSMVIQTSSAIAVLSAGFLADQIFESAMLANGLFSQTFSLIFGNEAGSGMALLYSGCAVAMLLVGISGFYSPKLSKLESLNPEKTYS